jgi:Ca2+-transporting ATPase
MIESGLTAQEARARLTSDGPNELPRTGTRSALKIIGEVLREPMLALLLAGGLVYLLLGNRVEALILLGFASFSIIVTVIQETRTEHVLEALRDLSAPRALVIRDGARVRIAGREVVAGDVLLLDAGDRVAADALLIDAQALHMDESLLTGESLPVRKAVGTEVFEHRPGGDGQPYVYAGSLVTSGTGMARAFATGPRSEIGKIGQSLATLDPEAPRLRAETTRIVALCAIGGGTIALLVVVLYGLTARRLASTPRSPASQLGMAMLPEEFPVVLTVFMAMGAMADRRARACSRRRAAAIETLGSRDRPVHRQDRDADREPDGRGRGACVCPTVKRVVTHRRRVAPAPQEDCRPPRWKPPPTPVPPRPDRPDGTSPSTRLAHAA